ncbi:MAG: hypothetical protein ABUT20_10780 [Bacteroidota bacterium]
MKKIANKMTIGLLVVVCVSLFSFTKLPGGDSFQVYLNGKLVLDKALYGKKSIQNLELLQASSNDKVEIYYSHCGHTGTSRSLTAKNEQQKILKTWKFPDANGSKMSLRLQELRDLQANNKSETISLYYSSKELPSGQELASVSVNNKSIAAK